MEVRGNYLFFHRLSMGKSLVAIRPQLFFDLPDRLQNPKTWGGFGSLGAPVKAFHFFLTQPCFSCFPSNCASLTPIWNAKTRQAPPQTTKTLLTVCKIPRLWAKSWDFADTCASLGSSVKAFDYSFTKPFVLIFP